MILTVVLYQTQLKISLGPRGTIPLGQPDEHGGFNQAFSGLPRLQYLLHTVLCFATLPRVRNNPRVLEETNQPGVVDCLLSACD